MAETYIPLPSLKHYDEKIKEVIDDKQDKLVGTEGQIVSFDENGNVISKDLEIHSVEGLDERVNALETNLGGHTIKSDVPSDAKFTDTTNFIPLVGGTLNENAKIVFPSTSYGAEIKIDNDTETVQLYADGLYIENTDSNEITQVNASSITSPEFKGNLTGLASENLPLTGGTMKENAKINIPSNNLGATIELKDEYLSNSITSDGIYIYDSDTRESSWVGASSINSPKFIGDLEGTINGHTVEADVPSDAKFTDTVYTLPTASSTLGGVKTTSTVTSTSGLTATPIIDGVPYYDKRTAVSSPLPNGTTFGTFYPMLCSAVATNVASLSVDTGVKFGPRSGSLTLDGNNTTIADSSFVSLAIKIPKSGQYSSKGILITPAGDSSYHTGMSIDCGTSTGPGMMGLNITCTANTHQPTLQVNRTGGTNSYAISSQKGRSYIADIYSNAAVNTTSDREKKTDIKSITSEYEDLFFKLQPRLFKYKDGNSGRIHIGAIAQEVEEALNTVGIPDTEFAGFVRQEKDYVVNEETGEVTQEEGYDYYLRYEEFIMLLCHMLQKLYTEKDEQNKKIGDLEDRLAVLESKLV